MYIRVHIIRSFVFVRIACMYTIERAYACAYTYMCMHLYSHEFAYVYMHKCKRSFLHAFVCVAGLIKVQNTFAHKIFQYNALWVQKLSGCTISVYRVH